MKRGIISIFLTVSFCVSAITGIVHAAPDIDYSEELTQIESLLKQCEAKGISTEYERVNYTTVKMFNNYLKSDVQEGSISDAVNNYNIARTDELCAEAVNNLTAYLSGTKKPLKVKKTDMTNITKSGNTIYSGGKAVFANGLTMFEGTVNEIPRLAELGYNYIQIEAGPEKIEKSDVTGWKTSKHRNVAASASAVREYRHSGSKSMKIVHTYPEIEETNVDMRLTQDIPVKPNTKYDIGFYVKMPEKSSFKFLTNGWESNKIFMNGTTIGWEKKSSTYTTDAETYIITPYFVTNEPTKAYIDDFYVYELDSAGNRVGDNLAFNSGFEDEDVYYESISYIVNALKLCEQFNVGADVLISAQTTPEGVEVSDRTDHWIKYNINTDKAKAAVENHIRTVMEKIKDFSSLRSVCLTNEPHFDTRDFPDFYTSRFQGYLKTKHGENIAALNDAYGLTGNTGYGSYDEIRMPSKPKSGLKGNEALYVDWMEYNDKVFADWHIWMAEIVREYTAAPIHSKMQPPFLISGDTEYNLGSGVDVDLFGQFSDWAGNDGGSYYDNSGYYYNQSFLYDYQQTAVGKPVFNSEHHIIYDGNSGGDIQFIDTQRTHMRHAIWSGAAHGMQASVIWLWSRNYDNNTMAYGSIMHRPDVLAEAGKTTLDMQRLSGELEEIKNIKPRVAIMYSKTSRVYNSSHMYEVLKVYEALLGMGFKVGIVSEKSLDTLADYDALICSYVTNADKSTVDAVKEWASNKNKKLLYKGSLMQHNQYGVLKPMSISNKTEYSGITVDSITSSLASQLSSLRRVTVKTADGNNPARIDWKYKIRDDGSVLINITSIIDGTSENASGYVQNLEFYLDGEKITELTDLITGKKYENTIPLKGFTPMLLTNRKEIPIIYTVGISEVVNNDSSFTCRVTTKNDTDKEEIGAVKLELLDSKGNVMRYHYQVISFKACMEDTYKISLPVDEKVYGYRAYVTDNTSYDNIVSNIIEE